MPGRCRQCGCSDYDACFDPATGAGCYWVDEDLCSVCDRLIEAGLVKEGTNA
jgi:hypothetical protein